MLSPKEMAARLRSRTAAAAAVFVSPAPIVPPVPLSPATPQPPASDGKPARDERGYWLPGSSGNPSGMVKGKAMAVGELRKLAREMTPECLETLRNVMQDPFQTGAARVAAVSLLLDRGYGKAIQPVEVGGPGAFDQMNDTELDEYISSRLKLLVGTDDGRKI